MNDVKFARSLPNEKESGSALLKRWEAGQDLTADQLLSALIYARTQSYGRYAELDQAETAARHRTTNDFKDADD